MKKLKYASILFLGTLFLSSCSLRMNGISNSNAQLNLTTDDVEISEQKEVIVEEKLIFGIDWKRARKKEIGQVRRRNSGIPIPVIGANSFSRAESYALYRLLEDNPGYDAILYPQFSGQAKGFLPIFFKTELTVKAKLVKLK